MASKIGVDKQYWLRRSNMMYYKYIDILVKAFAYDAKSIIDIGSANTEYIESFHWVPKKYTLDIKNPYKSPNVISIETDFLDYVPDEKFDFATCLQVLEHIEEAEKFAKKLFEVSDRVLISVPYKWPEDAEEEHVNDPVDYEKLKQWTGRDPSYSIIVAEPLRIPSKGISKRLICYYGPEEEKVNFKKVNQNVERLNRIEDSREQTMDLLLEKLEENNKTQESIKHDLNKLYSQQKVDFQVFRVELENLRLESIYREKLSINNKRKNKLTSLQKEISRYKRGIAMESKEQQIHLKEYNKVLQSTSWKLMAPFRGVGAIFKSIYRTFVGRK